jgi:hypothetical protein
MWGVGLPTIGGVKWIFRIQCFDFPEAALLALVSAAMGKALLTQTPDAVAEDLEDDDDDEDTADAVLDESTGNA